MTEASRVQKLLIEQNAEIDRLKNRIEKLEDENKRLLANATYDAELLVVYHRICQKNGCAPSSSDLVAGLAVLKGEKK